MKTDGVFIDTKFGKYCLSNVELGGNCNCGGVFVSSGSPFCEYWCSDCGLIKRVQTSQYEIDQRAKAIVARINNQK